MGRLKEILIHATKWFSTSANRIVHSISKCSLVFRYECVRNTLSRIQPNSYIIFSQPHNCCECVEKRNPHTNAISMNRDGREHSINDEFNVWMKKCLSLSTNTVFASYSPKCSTDAQVCWTNCLFFNIIPFLRPYFVHKIVSNHQLLSPEGNEVETFNQKWYCNSMLNSLVVKSVRSSNRGCHFTFEISYWSRINFICSTSSVKNALHSNTEVFKFFKSRTKHR